MAKAPKTSTRKPSSRAKAGTRTDAKVEDAVVIEETAPAQAAPAPEKPKPEPKAQTPGTEPKKPEPQAKPKPQSEAAAKAAAVPEAQPKDSEAKPASNTLGTATEESSAKETPPPRPAPAPEKSRRGATGFIGLLLGGVAAAAIGFVAARTIVPEGWPFPGVTPEPDPLALAIKARAEEIALLTSRIAALEADTGLSDLTATVTTRLDAVQAMLDATAARLDEAETRLAAVERLAPEGSAAAQMAAEAYDRELAALREMFESELAKVEAAQTDASLLEAQAAEAAKAAAGRAALARVMAALNTGQPFDEALADLTEATGIDAPAGLAEHAADGVPTLATLQDAFPASARAALDAATRAQVESGEVSRFSAFLKTQLGTRSLEPREGDDADAVLSRAEAALKQGDITAALTELEALPEAGQPAFADWREMADKRKDALDAGAALSETLIMK